MAGLFVTAAPFLLAAAAAWVVLVMLKWPPASLRAGVLVAATTWSLGMVLRGVAFGGGTATAFVVVAGVSLAATMLGWRGAGRIVRRRAESGDKVTR